MSTAAGSLDSVDERLVRNALYSQRGFGLSPVPGFDLRADVFGRGSVDVTAVDAVRTTLEAQVTGSVRADQRPITVAWHYRVVQQPDPRTGDAYGAVQGG